MTSQLKVKPNQRLIEYPNQGFMIADSKLYCSYCNCNVNWIHKSDVLRHTQAAKHAKAAARQRVSANVSILVSGNLGDGPDVPDSDPGEGSSTRTVVLSTVSSSRGNPPKPQRIHSRVYLSVI